MVSNNRDLASNQNNCDYDFIFAIIKQPYLMRQTLQIYVTCEMENWIARNPASSLVCK